MSFDTALSGLQAATTNLDVIGNNIANANTVGFKAGAASFADVYAAVSGGTGGGQVGLGTSVGGVRQDFGTGAINTTNNSMDVAINGNGFFQVNSNGTTVYSRDGQLSISPDGFLVNSGGGRVQGYLVDATGKISRAAPTDMVMPTGEMPPASTTTATITGNLQSDSKVPTSTTFNPTNSTSFNSSTTVSVYDSLGVSHNLSLYFVNSGTGSWSVYTAMDGTATATTPAATLNFSSSGVLSGTNTLTVAGQTLASGAKLSSIAVDLSSMTQFSSAFNSTATQNGYGSGQLVSYKVTADGTITGAYSNNQNRTLGQLALASFVNPQGLQAIGGNAWRPTSESGVASIGQPGTGTLGLLQSGAVEASNVDVTAQLVDLITAQRNYQANAQVIKTQDQVAQILMNM